METNQAIEEQRETHNAASAAAFRWGYGRLKEELRRLGFTSAAEACDADIAQRVLAAAEPLCTCNRPLLTGMVHRRDSPCYWPERGTRGGITDERIRVIFRAASADPVPAVRKVLEEVYRAK